MACYERPIYRWIVFYNILYIEYLVQNTLFQSLHSIQQLRYAGFTFRDVHLPLTKIMTHATQFDWHIFVCWTLVGHTSDLIENHYVITEMCKKKGTDV